VSTKAIFEAAPDLSDSLFKNIVEHASDGILVVDYDGYVMLSNPAVAELFQRHREEINGNLFGFPIAPAASVEINILRKDGFLATAEMRVSEAYWQRERVYIAILRDISERKQMEMALRQTQEELATLYHFAPLGMLALKTDWCIKLVNPAAENIFGWAGDEIIDRTLLDLSAPLKQDLVEINHLIQQGKAIKGKEVRLLKKDGTPVEVSISAAPVLDKLGQAAAIMCIVEDISHRIREAERLQLSGKIFENTQECILVTDANGVIFSVNPAFVAVTGYTANEAIGRKPTMLNSGRHDQAFYSEMWRSLIEQGQWRGEIWNRRKNGDIYPEWTNISAIHDAHGAVTHYVAIFSDISKTKENEARLQRLAHFDLLTGLPNRFLFKDHAALALSQAARKGKQVAILFIDLDHFKAINDQLGHHAGDAVLIEVARRLVGCLRATDTLTRFGGDEFNAILPDIDTPLAAASVAEKIIKSIATPCLIEGQALKLGVSIGIAMYPRDGGDLDVLSQAADAAMYQAKEHGRNTYRIFNGDMSVFGGRK
jgi:diguanylate cyclase (GGDEF)-like protein/PAS domain S-box-containing protein